MDIILIPRHMRPTLHLRASTSKASIGYSYGGPEDGSDDSEHDEVCADTPGFTFKFTRLLSICGSLW